MMDDLTEPTSTPPLDLFLRVLLVSKVMQEKLAAAIEPALGISLGELEVLIHLAAAPSGRLRMRDISDSLLVNRTAVTRLIDNLERRGLAERLASEGDRRGVWAIITETGREMPLRAEPLLDEASEDAAGRFLSSDETNAVRCGLGKILEGNGVQGPSGHSEVAGGECADEVDLGVEAEGARGG
jgi:DNA-binding MarR family transcriptional regulator